MKDIRKSEGKILFDELTEPKFSYPGDFDEHRLLKFLELAGLSKSVKTETILVNLGVSEKQEGKLYINNAGVLFFAKQPQRFVPWSVYTVALFKDVGELITCQNYEEPQTKADECRYINVTGLGATIHRK